MKVLAFGDSFVKMFIHCQPQVKHWKFKGKSMKGLAKEDDVERRRIQKQIRKTPSGTKILMFFGQVDFNYVRYYKIIKGQAPITEQTFEKYVQWVSSLNNRNNISVVSIFPSPIKRENIISSLINKGSYLVQQRTVQIDNKILAEYQKSPAIWQLWNSWLKYYCQKLKVNNIRLFKQNFLQPEFYDISGLTIHLRYVPVLKLVKKYVDITFDAQKAQLIEKQYEKQKVDRIATSIIRLESGNSESSFVIQEVSSKIQQISQVTNQRIKQTQMQCSKIMKKQSEIVSNNAQDFCQMETIKNNRKYTADLDTDTNLQKQSNKSKQTQQISKQNQNQKEDNKDSCTDARTVSIPKQEQKKKKRKNKKSKNVKQKATKEKKKYVCAQESSQSEDDGERFLQLSIRSKRRN